MIKITFTKGALKGQCLDLKPKTALSIGRSHTCDLRCLADDVSGHHIRLSTEGDGTVTMLVESQYGVIRNGVKCERGLSVALQPGDEVQLGKSNVFKVEGAVVDDSPTLVGNLQDTQVSSTGFIGEQTVIRQPDPAPKSPLAAGGMEQTSARPTEGDDRTSAGGETVAIQTVIANDEDFDKINREYTVRRRNRFLAWFVPSVVAFICLVTAYIVLKPAPEEFTSWPRDVDGNWLNKYVLVEPFLAVCVPDVPAFSSADLPSGKRIESAIGRDRDIPLFVTVERYSDKGLLETDHDAAFEAYLVGRRESDTMFSTGANRIKKFICITSGAGVPVTYVDYTRRTGADEFFGYLLYLRRADVAYAFNIEVPLAARWRAEKFLESHLESFVLYAPKRVPEHWEGGQRFRRKTPVARDLDEAKSFLVRSRSPMNWEKGLYCLKSVLIKGTEGGDVAAVKEAEELLVKLRARQSDWYNTCKLGYLEAKVADDKERMQSLQSMCESVFTAAFQDCDYRYDRIKRKDWH